MSPEYGAVGDGSTNDGPAINAAIAGLPAGGGFVFLPPGKTFLTNNVITLSDGESLISWGSLKEGGSTGAVLKAGASLGTGNFIVSMVGTGSVVKGITFNGFTNNCKGCIIITGSSALGNSVEDCFAQGGLTNTLLLDVGCKRNNIAHCRFDGNNQPSSAVVEVNSVDQDFHDVRMTGGAPGGTILKHLGSGDQYTNCHITGNVNVTQTVLIQGARNRWIGNYFDTCGDGSHGNAMVKILGNGGQTMMGNIFYNANANTNQALVIQKSQSSDAMERILLIGNKFDGNNFTFANMVQFLNESGNTPANLSSFAHNVFQGNAAANTAAFTNVGSLLDGSANAFVTFKDNHISGPVIMQNNNRGLASFNGTGSATSFNIAHNLGLTPTWAQISPASTDAAGSGGTSVRAYVSSVNATNIVVNCSTAPVSGTNNVKFYWQAEGA